MKLISISTCVNTERWPIVQELRCLQWPNSFRTIGLVWGGGVCGLYRHNIDAEGTNFMRLSKTEGHP
jgi:hypothetical protein